MAWRFQLIRGFFNINLSSPHLTTVPQWLKMATDLVQDCSPPLGIWKLSWADLKTWCILWKAPCGTGLLLAGQIWWKSPQIQSSGTIKAYIRASRSSRSWVLSIQLIQCEIHPDKFRLRTEWNQMPRMSTPWFRPFSHFCLWDWFFRREYWQSSGSESQK